MPDLIALLYAGLSERKGNTWSEVTRRDWHLSGSSATEDKNFF